MPAVAGNTYLNLIAAAGRTAMTHLALVDETGTELSGGGYARGAVTWTSPSAGDFDPTGDVVINVPAGATVGGWRGASAASGGTMYDLGFDYDVGDQETYANAGTFTVKAADLTVAHNATA